ncbi:MAG TPA: hypothetical protein VNL35_24085 [Chloroflexota bacterium]|nr:hypothetical protein [Chloroflexota bacterium]
MRIKRTDNLSPVAVATVKRLVEVDHVAATQDALVEQAIAELDRAVHDAYEAHAHHLGLDILARAEGASGSSAFKV